MKKRFFWRWLPALLMATIVMFYGCGGSDEKKEANTEKQVDPMTDKGIGPVASVLLTAVDTNMVVEGQKIYTEKCTACHNPERKLLGPPQKDIMKRRTPEWILNMILDPQDMLERDPVAKQLLLEYNNVPMTNQGLSQTDARKVLEYFRTL